MIFFILCNLLKGKLRLCNGVPSSIGRGIQQKSGENGRGGALRKTGLFCGILPRARMGDGWRTRNNAAPFAPPLPNRRASARNRQCLLTGSNTKPLACKQSCTAGFEPAISDGTGPWGVEPHPRRKPPQISTGQKPSSGIRVGRSLRTAVNSFLQSHA